VSLNVVLWNPRAAPSHRRLPLSLLTVARTLRDPWELVDSNVEPNAEARLEALCARPDTVLLVTVMPGPQLRAAVPVCRRLKARHPALRIVWGGYFPSVHPAACVRDPSIDAVVVGQGEQAAPALLDALREGRDPAGTRGVAVWRDGAMVQGPAAPYLRPADFGPLPYERVDMERYAARTFLGARTYNHHASAGCPYRCNFCAVVNVYDGRWIPDPADDVVRTVEHLARRYRADAVEFHDNNFFAWEKRTRAVADGLTGLGVSWWGEGRIDTMLEFSDATWEALARSGLRMVFYGAESGDDAVLARMDKGGLEVRHTRALNLRARRYGIRPEFSFVLGNPGDPEGDAERSLALARALKQENPDCEIILYLYTPVPLPGMYDDAVAAGFSFPDSLDGWLSPEWGAYAQRRDPRTPWMREQLRRRVHAFETVLHARHPSATDLNLRGWQRAALRVLAAPRWRLGLYRAPWELKLLQRAWGYRRPEEMGF
jgi:anaerobic magnesium-protoporphyrin IX monomethyl ester cyclase